MTMSVLALLCKGGNWWSSESPSLPTKFLSQILSKMVTCRGTDQSAHTNQMQEKHEAELALQKKMEEEHKKCQQENLLQKEEHRKEEEVQKKLEDEEKEQRNAEATAAADSASAQLISPSNPKDVEMEDPNLNRNLFGFMNGEGEEESKDANRSPPKNKPKKSNKAVYKQALAAKTVDKPGPVKHVVKSALKAGFKDNHVHNFPRILVEASIELKGESPEQELIVSLQELLKNG